MAIVDLFRLDGRVAVVTGAGGGIGRAIVAAFRDVGARVVALDRVVAELDALVGADGAAFPIDVADPPTVAAVFAQIVERFGGVDVLVNNAGVAYRA
ncbi:MAG: SDR family NAD(P)-dependent oxidoreductase, partial [Dehalococcoidia bacterium]|nr:SDR family NAD(P)-dependent oxidoreductase [Dehalococcoidia bacterium]